MAQRTITRRQMMRRGGAALGTATVLSTAGCAGRLDILGGNGYAKWLPEPNTVNDSDHYDFSVRNYSKIAEYEDEFSSDTTFDGTEDRWAPADIDWEDVSMSVSFNGIQILKSEFDKDDVVDDFTDQDFDDESEHLGYTILEHPNKQSAVGVSGGKLVGAGLNWGEFSDPVGAVEGVIDAKNGEEDRYVEESDNFKLLTNKLGSGTIVWGGTMEETGTDDPENGNFENKVADGRNLNIEGSTTKGKWVLLFEDGDDVDTDDVEDWIDTSQDNDGTFNQWDDLNVNKSGRAAIIEGQIDTDDL